MPHKPYQRNYLSPHLDDAALSCGGRIYQERQAGLAVLVLTLMAGDPPPEAAETSFVAELHARWELDAASNPVAARRAEDKRALSLLDAHGQAAVGLFAADVVVENAGIFHDETSLPGDSPPWLTASGAVRSRQVLSEKASFYWTC